MKSRWLWALLVVFVLLFVRYDHRAQKRQASDFRVTYAAAQAFLQKGDFYTKFEDPTIAIYKYSPFCAMLAAPLALLTLHQAAMVFFTLNFLFTVLMFVYARRLIAGEEGPADWRLYLLPLLFTGRLFLKVMDAGQVNIVMVGLVVFALYATRKGRDVLAAALFMLAVMIKYTPIIFIPYFFVRKKWKLALFSAVFAGIYCVLPMAYVGFEKGLKYLLEWMPFVVQTSLDIPSLTEFRNQSLCAALLRYFSSGHYFVDRITLTNLTIPQGLLLSTLVSGGLYLLMLLPGRRDLGGRFAGAIDASLLLAGVALFNANSWTFNYMALFFAYMTLTHYSIQNGFKDKAVVAAVLVAFVLGLSGRGIVGEALREWSDVLALVTIGALVLCLALFKLKFFGPGAGPSRSSAAGRSAR